MERGELYRTAVEDSEVRLQLVGHCSLQSTPSGNLMNYEKKLIKLIHQLGSSSLHAYFFFSNCRLNPSKLIIHTSFVMRVLSSLVGPVTLRMRTNLILRNKGRSAFLIRSTGPSLCSFQQFLFIAIFYGWCSKHFVLATISPSKRALVSIIPKENSSSILKLQLHFEALA